MVADRFIAMHHIPSHANLADVLSKHWVYQSVYNLLQPIFHYVGNTASLYHDDDPDSLDIMLDELEEIISPSYGEY